MSSNYNKAIAAVGAAVVAVLALAGVDASATVETFAAIFVAATPFLVALAPKNVE